MTKALKMTKTATMDTWAPVMMTGYRPILVSPSNPATNATTINIAILTENIPVHTLSGIGNSGVRLVKKVKDPLISTLHTSTSSVAQEKVRQHLYAAGMSDC